ncbi:hypothetical protein ACFXK0_09850 [Nocardia sp. NPDC059177]|uniref:hypothetical protein n=1 Tax=Nocardia sp. NPDC059177 TaxID=3346759 RepID=UPI00368B5B14
MATVTRHYAAAKSTMTPSTLVTLGLILLIPVLATAGPIAASALIARYGGLGWSGWSVYAVIAVVVCGSVAASMWAFRLAWRRGSTAASHSSDSLAR